ncbi:hypothetical protein JOM56_007107, partial [Amanita muscaria]
MQLIPHSNVLTQFLIDSLYKRISLTSSPGTKKRFIDLFFQSVTEQVADRASVNIPDLESYFALRRDTSGSKPCWALIECERIYRQF